MSVRDSLESNPLSLRLLSSSISTSLFSSFECSSCDLLGERLLVSFVLLLSVRSANNPSVQCLSCLDSALALDGIGAIIEANLRGHIEKCLKAIDQEAAEGEQGELKIVCRTPQKKHLSKNLIFRRNSYF